MPSPAAPQTREYDRGGLVVVTRKGPILNAHELEVVASKLAVPPPEICFGHNGLSLRHAGFSYHFDAVAALAAVDATGAEGLQVAHAAEWAKTRQLDGGAGVTVVQKWDWTYTTTYAGTFEPAAPGLVRPFLPRPGAQPVLTDGQRFEPASVSHPGIPMRRLAAQDEPILFFDEVTLFEDELHDCGMANLIVRVRVMPSFVFVLSRFFLRVDRVLFRIFDVRLYHAFGSREVLREVRGQEARYDDVKRHLPTDRPDDLTPLTDPIWVANTLGMLQATTSASLPVTAVPPASVRAYLADDGAMRRGAAPLASPPPPSAAAAAWTGQRQSLEILTLP